MLIMLEIPKPDAPLPAPPTGIPPEKLAAVKAAERELEEGMHAGVSPQKLTILLDRFWSAQKAVAGEKPLISGASCPSCGAPAERIPNEREERRRCTCCSCTFSSPQREAQPCPRCQATITVRLNGRTHCNSCALDF
jgi:hypothetical protein